MSSVYWNRLRYVLSPQFDVYEQIARIVSGKVADVGSGTGFGTHLLCRGADRVDGYEVDPDAKEFSQRCFSNGVIRFYEADITRPTPAAWFRLHYDFVVMVDVIEHIEDDAGELARAATRLAPGGKLIVLAPAHQFLFSPFDEAIGHFRRYTRKTLAAAAPEEPHERLPMRFWI